MVTLGPYPPQNRTCAMHASGSPISRGYTSGWSTRGAGRVNQGRWCTHAHVARRVSLRRRRVHGQYRRAWVRTISKAG